MSGERLSSGRFFSVTFALSWAVWLPLTLMRFGVLKPVVPEAALVPVGLLGVLMPSVAAFLMSSRQGAGRIRGLVRRLLIWRVGWIWLAAIFVQPAILLAVAAVNSMFKWDAIRFANPSSGAFVTTLAFLIVAATGEELGWRGYALPALQSRFTPLVSSIVLGLAVATWHLPYWLLQDIPDTYGLGYLALNYVFVVAVTVQLTWLFNRANSSVLIAVVFHVVFNAFNVALLPVTSSVPAFGLLTAIESALAVGLLGSLQPRTSTAASPNKRIDLTGETLG